MKISPPLILAIEAAISGGSFSLIHERVELANWIGTSNVTKAESLLADIDLILRENGHSVRDIHLVAVSAGPGSFTGIRIGVATALGLTTGLGIEMASESALVAMANEHRGHKNLIAAVPAGRETVCSQSFDTSDGVIRKSEPRTDREDVFLSSFSNSGEATFVVHGDLFEKGDPTPHIIDFGRNIALAIGKICEKEPRPQARPLFISKNP